MTLDGLSNISDVASRLGLTEDEIVVHGPHRAKVRLSAVPGPSPTAGAAAAAQGSRYVLVTAMTPSGRGAGKTVTAIGLSMGLNRLGRKAVVTLRQSALGPTFGGKGGGAGGGHSQVVPLEESLLGLGSDTFAVESANNLLAAVVDDALHRGATFDPESVGWRRVIDTDDRFLRVIRGGMGGKLNGPERLSGFDITAASEVMAVLMMSRDVADLRRRLGSIVVAWDSDGRPVTAESLEVAGSMAAMLVDALQPNLMQTSEGTPALIHTGPFGNLATGNGSVISDLFALGRAEFVVTEAGFGSDLGAEKFYDLKSPLVGRKPDATVIVATMPCIRGQSGDADGDDLSAGIENLCRHIGIVQSYGVPAVVAVNRFPDDTDAELARVEEAAVEAGAAAVEFHTAYAEGSQGATGLARAVIDACEIESEFTPLFQSAAPVEDKVEILATRLYGAAAVEWDQTAREQMRRFRDAGFGNLPVCMAKTHLSLSHDPKALGAPKGYVLPIREARLYAGAGYVTVLAGDISTMPGLPGKALFRSIDVLPDGTITGLS